ALVAGRPPLSGTTAQKIVHLQLKEPPVLTRSLKGKVPPELGEVVAKMMAKKKADRYRSAQEVIDALSPWLPSPSTGNIVRDPVHTADIRGARATAPRKTRRPPPAKAGALLQWALEQTRHERKRWLLIGGSAAALAAVVLVAFLVRGGKRPPEAPQNPGRTAGPVAQAPAVPNPAAVAASNILL